ncbi:MAG TPA: hypothetical protein VIQ03_05220 [Gammaproteobacteria bacterium]
MKTSVSALIIGFLTAVILLVAIFWFFNAGISGDDSDQILAAFGSYIGGVLTPITVLAALIALIQRQNTHNNEMERLAAQGHKADLLRFIEKIEEDIDSTLNQLSITIELPGQAVHHPASDALFKLTMQEWKCIIPSEAEVVGHSGSSMQGLPRYDEKLLGFEVFGMVAAYIKRLREHCEEYDKAANNNVTSIYFSRKYKLATQRLNEKGYKINIWDLSA